MTRIKKPHEPSTVNQPRRQTSHVKIHCHLQIWHPLPTSSSKKLVSTQHKTPIISYNYKTTNKQTTDRPLTSMVSTSLASHHASIQTSTPPSTISCSGTPLLLHIPLLSLSVIHPPPSTTFSHSFVPFFSSHPSPNQIHPAHAGCLYISPSPHTRVQGIPPYRWIHIHHSLLKKIS